MEGGGVGWIDGFMYMYAFLLACIISCVCVSPSVPKSCN